jgi:hypothetical protein
MSDIERLLSRFPKERIVLSREMAAAHKDILKANRERKYFLAKISNQLEAWMHRKAAQKGDLSAAANLLEIGAGTLNHLPFEGEHPRYDAIEPFHELYDDKPGKAKVRNFYADISEIDISQTYDRIVSIATLEHLTELPYTIAKSGLMLRPGGMFQSGIPSEGGLLWGLSWRFTTAIAFYLRTGLAFADHMTYEHVNDAKEIISILNYFYDDVHLKRFPFPSHHLSLYVYLEAREPNIERCNAYLDDLKTEIS